MAKVQLLRIAHARSGDKGDTANVGLIALKPEYYPVLVQQVTAERVWSWTCPSLCVQVSISCERRQRVSRSWIGDRSVTGSMKSGIPRFWT